MFKGYKPIVFDTKELRLLKDTEYFRYKLIPSDMDSTIELRPNGFVSRADYSKYYSHHGRYSELDKGIFKYKVNGITYGDITKFFYESDEGIFEYKVKDISVVDLNKNLGIELDKGIFSYVVKKTSLQDYPSNGVFINCAAIHISYSYTMVSTGVVIKRTAIVKDFKESNSSVYFQITPIESGIFIPKPDNSVVENLRVTSYSMGTIIFKDIVITDEILPVTDTLKMSTFTVDKLTFSDKINLFHVLDRTDTLKVSEYKIDSVIFSLKNNDGIDLGWAN
jgi:hypothetical protein